MIEKAEPGRTKKLPLVEQVSTYLTSKLKESQKKGQNVLLLLSGGSSLQLLEGIDPNGMGPTVTLSPLDERYSTNPDENNMAQIAGTNFFRLAQKKGAQVIDTRVKAGETKEELAERFNQALNLWFERNPEGKVIATVGIGPDGHLSGIMPHPEDPVNFKTMFDDGDEKNLVVAYDAGDKNQFPLRVTTTMNLIRRVDEAVCYVSGDYKKEALEKTMAEKGDVATTPARILREISGRAILFTDQRVVW